MVFNFVICLEWQIIHILSDPGFIKIAPFMKNYECILRPLFDIPLEIYTFDVHKESKAEHYFDHLDVSRTCSKHNMFNCNSLGILEGVKVSGVNKENTILEHMTPFLRLLHAF